MGYIKCQNDLLLMICHISVIIYKKYIKRRRKLKLDYSKIKSYDELIEIARNLETDEQKVFLLCNYFIQNVSYNYAYLETIRIDKEDTGIEKMVKDINYKYNEKI